MTDDPEMIRLQAIANAKAHRFETAKRWLIAFTAALVAALLVVAILSWVRMSSVLSAIRASQVANHHNILQTKDAAQASADTLALLRDCLTPGGNCYRQGKANTRQVLALVTLTVVAADLCSANEAINGSVNGVSQCVSQIVQGGTSHDHRPH